VAVKKDSCLMNCYKDRVVAVVVSLAKLTIC